MLPATSAYADDVATRRRRRSEPKSEDERLRQADEEHLRKLRQIQRARATKAVVLATLAVMFMVVVIQNSKAVEVTFLAWTWSVRLIWVFVVAAAAGGVAGFLVGRPGKQIRLHETPEESKTEES